jgi:hypothetical protein
LKVYRNPRVRADLAETFTIAKTFNYLNFVRSFLEIPRFLAPIEIEAGLLVTFLRELKVLAIVKVSANSVRTRGFL